MERGFPFCRGECVWIVPLNALYDSDRKGGLNGSAPKVSRWLGDIRGIFPQTVVQVIQKDAIKRLNLTSLLTEKEMLESVVPDAFSSNIDVFEPGDTGEE